MKYETVVKSVIVGGEVFTSYTPNKPYSDNQEAWGRILQAEDRQRKQLAGCTVGEISDIVFWEGESLRD